MANQPKAPSENLSASTSSLSEISSEDESGKCIDSELLQKIVPEEVWLIITEKLLNKQNKKDDIDGNFEFLSNSSPYFRTLLKPKRVLIMFELMFWIASPWLLATCEDDPGNSSDSDSDWDWETVEEYSDTHSVSYNDNAHVSIPKTKPLSVIKNCREVCSVWNQAISQLIYDKHIRPTQRGLHSMERRVLEKMEYEHFETTNDVNKFLNFFKATHTKSSSDNLVKGISDRSPFISKQVRVTLQCEDRDHDEDPIYPRAIESLLGTYGHHILGFDVIVEGFNTDVHEQLTNIARAFKIIQMIPNLRQLYVADHATNFFGTLNEALRELGKKIKKKPKYQLPHIPTLMVLQTSDLADPILKNLRKNNGQARWRNTNSWQF